MSLYRQLRVAPLIVLGSWLFATHCADPLAGDCRRTLTCGDEDQGFYTLDPDCVWRYPDGTIWREGPYRMDGVWYWSDDTPVGYDFVCGEDGIPVGGNGGAGGAMGGGGTGGAGSGGTGDAGTPEPMPLDPDCTTNGTGCEEPTQCDPVSGNCVGCVDNDDCTANAPFCSENACVACVTDSDCTLPGFPVCNPESHTCQPCTDSAQCERFENATQCNTALGGKCVQCLADQQCEGLAGTPQCNEETGACVQCTANLHCEDDRDNSLCDLTTNTCVPCVEGTTDCPAEYPICDIDGATARCVACTGNDGPNTCQDPNAANCSAGGDCIPCTDNAHCTHLGPNRSLCDTNLNPNRCVQCIVDDDCDSPTASRCVNNQCVECDRVNGASVGCGGAQQGGSVCDTSANPNRCVQCLGTDFAACGGNVCDSRNRTCTQFAVASAGDCSPCVSDAQCGNGGRCVEQFFPNDAPGASIGFFCLLPADPTDVVAPCGDAGRPYARRFSTTSIDNVAADVCGLNATSCPAYNDFRTARVCASANDGAACGVANRDDGVCDATGLGFQCSIPCTTASDCTGTLVACPSGFCDLP